MSELNYSREFDRAYNKYKDEEFSEEDFNKRNEDVWGELTDEEVLAYNTRFEGVSEYLRPKSKPLASSLQEESLNKLIGVLAYGAQEVQTPSDDVNQLKNADGSRASLTGFQDTEYTTHSQRQEIERAELAKLEDAPGFFSTLGTASDEVWASNAINRISARSDSSDTDYDPNFRLPPEQLEEFASAYSLKELEYLSDSTSPTNVNTRLVDIEDDRKRRQTLAEAGWTGLGSQLLMSVLDPSAIVLSLVSAPVVLSAKVGKVANILRLATVASVENAAIEAILVKGNTQADATDIYMAAVGGFVLGGAIGSISRTNAHATGKQGVVDALDEMDVVFNDIAGRYAKARDISHAVEAGGLNARQKRTAELQPPSKPLSSSQVRQLSIHKAGHESSLSDVKLNYELSSKRITKMKSKGKATKANKKHNKKLQKQALYRLEADTVSARISLHAKIESINARLARSEDNVLKSAELNRWNKLSEKEQMKELFPFRTEDFKARYTKSKLKSDEASIRASKAEAKDNQVQRGGEETGGDSVGAAKVKDPQYEIYKNPVGRSAELIDSQVNATARLEEKQGRNFQMPIPEFLKTDYTNLDKSQNIFARTLNRLFNENAQLGGEKTVSALTHANLADIKYAGKGAYDRGLVMYAEESNISSVRAMASITVRNEYNEKVVQAIRGDFQGDMPNSIKLASDGLRDQMAKATQLRTEAGEVGFTDLDTIANYFPDLMDAAKVNSKFNTAGWGDGDGISLLSKGYLQGDNSLTVRQADAMAEIKYNNMMNNQLYSIDDVNNIFRVDSTKGAEALLAQSGFGKADIKRLMDGIMDGDDWVQVTGRAKKSYRIDWNASHTAHGETIKISELMDTNAGRVVESYSHESALGSALAEMGIKSRGQLERFIEDIQKISANSGIWDKATANQMKAEMDLAVRLTGNTLTQLGGKSLIDYSKHGNRIGRLTRDMTGILRLQQIMFSTVPELSRLLTQVGLIDALRAIPSSGIFRRPNNWSGRDSDFVLKRPELREMEEILGYVGEKDLNSSLHIRNEDFNVDTTASNLLNKMEEATELGKRASGWVSAFNTVQGGIEKLATNAVNRKMLDFALGKRKLGAGSGSNSLANQIEMTGMGEQWKAIQKWVKVNSGKDSFEGRSVDTWNYRNMPPEIKRDFQIMMQRLTRRVVQRTNAGEQNSLWLGTFGSFLTQFRNYTLGSIEKQIVADARGDKAGMAINFLWGTGLAYASYATQANLRAMAMPKDKGEEFLEKAMGERLVWGVLSKHSQLASLGVVSDIAMATGAAPDELFDSGRIGQQKANPMGLVPALGLVGDIMGLGASGAEMAYEGMREDGDTGDAVKKFRQNANRLTPFMNTYYIGESYRTMTGLNDD